MTLAAVTHVSCFDLPCFSNSGEAGVHFFSASALLKFIRGQHGPTKTAKPRDPCLGEISQLGPPGPSSALLPTFSGALTLTSQVMLVVGTHFCPISDLIVV